LNNATDKNLNFNLYLLHGFTGSGLDFSLLKESIESIFENGAVRLRWLCPSLPGHGDSLDIDCSTQGQYDFLSQFIELNLSQVKTCDTVNRRNNILIAYSMGSRLGLYHAIQQTEFWDAIVLIGVNPGIESEAERALRKESDKKLSEKIEANGLPWFLDYWKSQPLIRTQSKASDDFQKAREERKNTLDAQGLQNSLLHFGQGVFPNLWDLIPSIQSPILLINGNLDLKYCAISQRFSESHSGAQCEVIKDCGHAPHIENPQETAKAITAFLKKHLF
jgi:2-succinyl-6-hydroxy-2,4-cyclohexadiene-1-carboxylate synthase